MADDDDALRHIDDALRQRGFKQDWSKPGRLYCGTLEFGRGPLGISIEIPDLDFVLFPIIRISDPGRAYDRMLPHVLGDTGFLCYLDRGSTVLDRYNPGGTVARCLKQAHEVLERAISGKSDRDFAEEFAVYWGGASYVDLPADFKGDDVTLYWLALQDPKIVTAIICEKDRIAEALVNRHRSLVGDKPPQAEPCTILRIAKPLTVDSAPGKWPPSSLASLTTWLSEFTTDAERALRNAISKGDGKNWSVVLRAPNGSFVACIELPKAFDKQEFMQNRRKELADNLFKVAAAVPVKRYTGVRIDRDYVFGRAFHGRLNLGGKKVMLVGCGAIGGFLAQQLAQSGAGTGERGEFCLVDNDILGTANLGRHLLGIPWLGVNKAEACQTFLSGQLPHVNLIHKAEDALELREKMLGYDLVVDATGEEAFSVALNHHAVRRRPNTPPVLFVWLAANGAAAQAIFTHDKNTACYKCLKPELGKPSRFAVVKNDPELVRVHACGDTTYAPFPVSRAMHAAALALDMALDWANGNPRPFFRSRVLDDRSVDNHPKDGNPDRSAHCPACR